MWTACHIHTWPPPSTRALDCQPLCRWWSAMHALYFKWITFLINNLSTPLTRVFFFSMSKPALRLLLFSFYYFLLCIHSTPVRGPVCQQCSGSIPKVNKLTGGSELSIVFLPRGVRVNGVSCLDNCPEVRWVAFTVQPGGDGLMDGQRGDETEGRHCWGGKQCDVLVWLK